MTAGSQVYIAAHTCWRTHTIACVQVPFLQDPNTGASMFESADIMQ